MEVRDAYLLQHIGQELPDLQRNYLNTTNMIKKKHKLIFFHKTHISLSNAKDLRTVQLAVACWLHESKRYSMVTFQDMLISNKIEAHLSAVQTVH